MLVRYKFLLCGYSDSRNVQTLFYCYCYCVCVTLEMTKVIEATKKTRRKLLCVDVAICGHACNIVQRIHIHTLLVHSLCIVFLCLSSLFFLCRNPIHNICHTDVIITSHLSLWAAGIANKL